jgi:ribosome-associated protein
MALEIENWAVEAAKALYGKKAENIRIYDVRGVSNLTDFTVVASGTSAPHLKALITESQHHMKELGIAGYRTSGTPDSGWVVADYVHVVVHVFSTEAREYYAIEKLWATAKEIPFPQP